MYITVGGRELEVVVHDPLATDADLASAAGLPLPASPRPLADVGLWSGQDLELVASSAASHGLELAVVGGLDSGRRVRLAPGVSMTIGRADGVDLPIDDLAVSRHHARIAADAEGGVRWCDAGSHNGSWLVTDGGEQPLTDGPVAPGVEVRVGATSLAVVPPVDDRGGGHRPPAGLTGTVPHNRPPRAAAPPPPAPVSAPTPPVPPGPPLPLGIVAVVGPLAMAAVMVVVLGNPAFALFALLSPVLAVGTHFESRRRQRTGGRRDAARWRADVDRFRAALDVAAAVELERRRAVAPDPAEVVRRATRPSTRLWERRPGHHDWLHLRLGTGAAPFAPTVIDEHHGPRHPDLAVAIETVGWLGRAPITVDLADGGVVGLVGDRRAALAVARSLVCQAAVHHGPADLPVLVACDAPGVDDWDWAKWLPHVDDAASGARRVAVGREAVDALADLVLREDADRPDESAQLRTLLVVVDGDGLLDGRRAPLRRLLEGRAGPVAGIVVASAVDQLPAVCSSIVTIDAEGVEVSLHVPGHGTRLDGVGASGVGAPVARRCARALARFDDSELEQAGAGLPAAIRLLTLLDLDSPTASAISDRWRRATASSQLRVPIGVDASGVVDLDLDRDGPHALVAGTTGAGKSELLRSLVAGLAASADPDHLTFLLVDFKGGSAFDACARLPHTVGLVTDLDAALAERALRCLDAELRHRERRLRSAGASDLHALQRLRAADPSIEALPRLVVVVDEFATLRTELPEFVDALVGVAQRGRSLGVHLVLATQRPAGAVSDHIKANTNLRIALRVQDRSESIDVVDVPDAASLPRGRPGRACLRFGPAEVTTLQTALVTAQPPAAMAPIELRPFTFAPGPAASPSTTGHDGAPSDLDRLVDACVEAWTASGRPVPRRPWPEPLPVRLTTAALTAVLRRTPAPAGLVAVGLADDPDHQRQTVAGWRPADGNLLVYGVGGSGTTSTLLALALALADGISPDAVEVFAVDHGSGDLRVLAAVPHVVAVLGAGELERQARLVRHLRAELDRRRMVGSGDGPSPRPIVVLVDGAAAFLAAFDDIAGMEILDAIGRVIADGPALGIHVVLTADRAGAVPAALSATVRQRWFHRLADPMEASAAGAPSGAAPASAVLPAGRFLDGERSLLVQVAVPECGWDEAFAAVAERWPRDRHQRTAVALGTLPDVVALEALATPTQLGPERPWVLPVGLAEADLAPAGLPLHEGDHVLVAGPGRSGRTSALATIATAVRAARPDAVLVGIAGRRSWLGSVAALEVAPWVPAAVEVVRDTRERRVPVFLFVDDADGVDDVDGALAALVDGEDPTVHVVAAGRAEVLRGQYTHWTRAVRRSRIGLLLCPQPDLDGDLLGVVLPRRPAAPLRPGRGYLVVDGAAALVQVATVAGSGP